MRYKFRYFNGIYKSIAKFVGPFQNFFLTWVIFFIIYFLISKLFILIGLKDYVINDSMLGNFQKITFICSVLWVAIYLLFRKGVFLQENRLVIARYTFTLTNWRNRIIVNYDDIESVNVNFRDLHFTKYRFSFVVPCGDEAYNVELTLKNGKKYFFSIEDQEEFCDNLNLLLEKRKNV
ncbi:MAG: hypothetical protein K2F67_05450 [Eubacterium sp.]|nr:hypothetical protein [Eubacterium sp.]